MTETAPDTERSLPDFTPRERVLQLRRIAQEHAEALTGNRENLDACGFFVRITIDADWLLVRMPEE